MGSSKTLLIEYRPTSDGVLLSEFFLILENLTQNLTSSSIMANSQIPQQFLDFFPELLGIMKNLPLLEELPEMQEWVEKIIDYNVKGGKMNRGIAVVESYCYLTNNSVTEENLKIAIALGWAVELLQAFFLVADDIMDDSHTRRTKPCWFRTNNLGVKAFNDSILLESVLYQLVSSYCKQQPYYLDILELLHDVTLQTSVGQAMDLLSAPSPNEKPNIDEFTMRKYNAIVKYKTAYYSFFLPVALAMHMAGYNNKETLKKAENILLPMGQFFQVQDDFLDCFGDPEVTGKVGTDIEDGKCSWLVVTALSICSPTQRQLILDHYGLKEESSVQLIKRLYKELDIPQLYAAHEENSYKELTNLVKNIEHDLPPVVFHGFMNKIYKRKL